MGGLEAQTAISLGNMQEASISSEVSRASSSRTTSSETTGSTAPAETGASAGGRLQRWQHHAPGKWHEDTVSRGIPAVSVESPVERWRVKERLRQDINERSDSSESSGSSRC